LLAHLLLGVASCRATAPLVELRLREGWPKSAARYRNEWLPQADWTMLEGIGYCLQLDVPLETAQLILGSTSYERPPSMSPRALGIARGSFERFAQWTRTQRIRTAASITVVALIVDAGSIPAYVRMGPKAKHLRELGMSDRAIAQALGVTDKTVAKAVTAFSPSRDQAMESPRCP
jgi:hypothetical protein